MSKVHKFRNSPHLFFKESKSRVVRFLGSKVFRWIFEIPYISNLLQDPGEQFPLSYFSSIVELWRQRSQRKTFEFHDSPLVSIVIALHNAEDTIENSINSLTSQSYENIEIIVVDDSSTDNSLNVVSELSKKHHQIRVLRSETNIGAARARNIGIQNSTGSFITFQDADDYSHPKRIERQLFSLLKSSSKRVSLCQYVRIDRKGSIWTVNGVERRKCIISMMFHKSIITDDIGFFRPFKISEDSDYYQRIKAFHGSKSETLDFKVLYFAGFSERSLLMSNNQIERVAENSVLIESSDLSKKYGHEIDKIKSEIAQDKSSAFRDFC